MQLTNDFAFAYEVTLTCGLGQELILDHEENEDDFLGTANPAVTTTFVEEVSWCSKVSTPFLVNQKIVPR